MVANGRQWSPPQPRFNFGGSGTTMSQFGVAASMEPAGRVKELNLKRKESDLSPVGRRQNDWVPSSLTLPRPANSMNPFSIIIIIHQYLSTIVILPSVLPIHLIPAVISAVNHN
ncbi:hypothetical protein Ocin01_08176 [Orchesella cincta]|uniref:Uncharacterized protein n=1 Tax=Orchesella cincta TaxID=48709 RepID=A0A1D2MZM8_ORCCI|nr:hypothetical protein Ocin01_08176 [Orchesella cincta]